MKTFEIYTYIDRVRPICLPNNELTRNYDDVTGNKLYVAGWANSINHRSNHLYKVQLEVMENSACARVLNRYSPVRLDDNILCAGDQSNEIIRLNQNSTSRVIRKQCILYIAENELQC